jgi:hypothetical protein
MIRTEQMHSAVDEERGGLSGKFIGAGGDS